MTAPKRAEPPQGADPQDVLRFVNLGGGGEVGRSCHVIQFQGKTIMLDCGMHPGYRGITALPFFDDIDLGSVDLLLVSHFHMDHAASVPYLTQKTDFKGRIFMTHPTKAVLQWMLVDSVRLSNIESDEDLLYNEDDVLACLDKIETVDFHSTFESEGIRFTPFHAGHILGAAMFLIEIASVKILFTGDYSREEDRHLRAAEVPNVRPDLLITESTFGTMVKMPTKEKEERLTTMIHDTVLKGGRVLMPHFAIGRVQELLLLLDEYWHSHSEIQHIPVYFASALARKVLVLYQAFVNSMNSNFIEAFKERNPFHFRHISNLRNFDKFEDIGPSVVVASNGMLDNGPSRKLLERWAPDPKNLLLLTGYSVEGTMAKSILTQPSEITSLDGHKIPRRIHVEEISFAAHVDFNENRDFIDAVQAPNIILVHGEYTTAQRLKSSLMSKYQSKASNEKDVKIFNPRNCETVELLFKSEKIARVIGKLARESRDPGKILSGVLVQKDFQVSLFDTEDLRELSGLNTSTVQQRQEFVLHAPLDLVYKQLEQMFGTVQLLEEEKDRINVSVLNAVTVRSISDDAVAVEWPGSMVNDSIADAVIMILLGCQSSMAALQATRGHKCDHSHFSRTVDARDERLSAFLQSQFGEGIKFSEDEATLTISIEKHSAEISLDTFEVTCDYEPLKSRVQRVLQRALETLTPLSISAEQQEQLRESDLADNIDKTANNTYKI